MQPDFGVLEIKKILSGKITNTKKWQSAQWDSIYARKPKVVIFGCGNLGRRLLNLMLKEGIHVVALSDNDSGKWGLEIAGIRILSPSEAAAQYGKDSIFVVSIFSPGHAETRKQLLSLGCVSVVSFLPLLWKYPDKLQLSFHENDLPSFYVENRDSILAAFRLLCEEESRNRFIGFLKWRMQGDFSSLLPLSKGPQYFPSDLFKIREGEVFIDCGAYNGDTLKLFASMVSSFSYHGYEPDPDNFAKLSAASQSFRGGGKSISCYRLATADREMQVSFDASGKPGASISSEGTNIVACVNIDNHLSGIDPTFIKMDIEGAELDALEGAENTIRRCSPLLAICLYHKPRDLWKIPLFIAGLGLDYKYYLRTYESDGFDTVLYAVPRGR